MSDLAEDEMYVCFFDICWYCLRVRCLAVYGLTLGMEFLGQNSELEKAVALISVT
jgi:hypothetical protein